MMTETGVRTFYDYDAMQRLTQALNNQTLVTESWTYDANGNRLTSAKTGTTKVNWAYNAADQLCWKGTGTGTCATPPAGAETYTFDANGNQTMGGTTTSAWTTLDQLASHTNTSSTTAFTYAGQGNTERLTSGATSFLNGSLGITRQTTAGAGTSFIRDPQGTLISMRNSAGASFYYTTDALGSTILLTDSAQAKAATYLYDSWGNTTTQTGTQAAANPWRYAGGYKDDATGYTKFGARYYGPGHGRFTQADPSGQEQNRYLYAGANPINFTDPSGLLVGELGGTFCFYACISLGLAQDDVTGAYAVTAGFGAGSPGLAGSVKVSPGEVSTSAGLEASCGIGPVTATVGVTPGAGGLGLSSGFSSGMCSLQWAASLRIG
jgi:RHS repeat-associated protein